MPQESRLCTYRRRELWILLRCAAPSRRVLKERDTEVLTSFQVRDIDVGRSHVTVEGPDRSVTAGAIVNCGGLFSDHLARMAGIDPEVRIVSFRGASTTTSWALPGRWSGRRSILSRTRGSHSWASI